MYCLNISFVGLVTQECNTGLVAKPTKKDLCKAQYQFLSLATQECNTGLVAKPTKSSYVKLHCQIHSTKTVIRALVLCIAFFSISFSITFVNKLSPILDEISRPNHKSLNMKFHFSTVYNALLIS